MIAVIFEVWPKAGHRQQYLDLAAELRPLLAEASTGSSRSSASRA